MNAIPIALTILVLAFQNTEASDASDTAVRDHFAERCRRYSIDAVSYNEVSDRIKGFSSYAEYTTNTLLTTGNKDDFCNQEQFRLNAALKDLADYLHKCLPKEEKYLRTFLPESFAAFLDFLCKNKGRNIDNILSTHGKNCMSALEQGGASAEVNNCFSKIFAPLKGTVRKAELCDDFAVAKRCFSQTLEHHCPGFLAFQSLNTQFWTALSKPCGNACSVTASCLVLVFAFFVTKLFS